jgi:hypothetical protein
VRWHSVRRTPTTISRALSVRLGSLVLTGTLNELEVGLEGQLWCIRTGRGTSTGRAKLPKAKAAIASMGRVSTYPVVSRGEAEIVAPSPPGFPANREVAT